VHAGKNRGVKVGGPRRKVMLDDDLLNLSGGYPTVLTQKSKELLNRAVNEDAKFLCSLQVLCEPLWHVSAA
jgi:hypothetical protein